MSYLPTTFELGAEKPALKFTWLIVRYHGGCMLYPLSPRRILKYVFRLCEGREFVKLNDSKSEEPSIFLKMY